MTERVWPDPLADSGPASDTAHDPSGSVPIEPVAVGSEEDRAFHPFADGQVDRTADAWGEWHRDQLAALAQHRQGAVSRSSPSASMFAPIASDTRHPFNASSDTNA